MITMRELFTDAANILAANAWGKGAYVTVEERPVAGSPGRRRITKCYCLEGAYKEALETKVSRWDNDQYPELWQMGRYLSDRVVSEYAGFAAPALGAGPWWNDLRAESKRQVVAMLRRIARSTVDLRKKGDQS